MGTRERAGGCQLADPVSGKGLTCSHIELVRFDQYFRPGMPYLDRVVFRPEARFELHRVGDAVAGRNVHSAVLDSLRLCVVF